MKTSTSLVVAGLLVACCNMEPKITQTSAIDIDAEIKLIHAMDSDWFAAEQRKDVETPLKYISSDFVLQAPNAKMYVGPEALRAFYAEFFKLPIDTVNGGSVKTMVAASGDLAVDYGFNHVVLTIDGKRVVDNGKYIQVLKKVDGAWKTCALSFSSDSPM